MLKQRILTAVILIPLVVWGILFQSTQVIALIYAVLILQGSWEWSRLAGTGNLIVRIVYVAVIAALLWYLNKGIGDRDLVLENTWLAVIWWCVAFVWIFIPTLASQKNNLMVMLKLLVGVLVLTPSWFALANIHSVSTDGPVWLLYGLILIWIADSGAYFAGRTWGKHKLAPVVSPGKSWEGAIGGFVLVAIYAWLATVWWLPVNAPQQYLFIAISIALVPVSILGDLLESLMKRQSGIKDSGSLLPGHGGVMDRIDSMTAVMPIYLWLMIMAGIV